MRETRFEDCGATSRKPRSKYAVIYAHRGDGDTWLQIFSENLRLLRVQRSGKPNWKRREEVGKVFKPKSSGLLCR